MLKLDKIKIKNDGINFQSLLDLCIPINYIYISLTNEDPSSIYGGTWTLITTNNSNPCLLTNTTSNYGTITSGSYNYSFNQNWTVGSIGLSSTQIGRRTTDIDLGSATLSHIHVNWKPGSNGTNYVGSVQKKMRGATAAVTVRVTKGDSDGAYKCVVGRKSDQVMANGTTTNSTLNHRHVSVDSYYKTNVTYNGTHNHSLIKTDGNNLSSVSFNNEIPKYRKIYAWRRIS